MGGLDQVALDTGGDLANLDQLDPKLWVALSCPTKGLEIDGRTLELLDSDRDGRVRVPEVLAAVRWCAVRLDDLGRLLPGSAELPLAAIATDTPEGRALLGGARQVLASLGKPDAAAVTPADVADTSRVFEKTLFNGDGILPPGRGARTPRPARSPRRSSPASGAVTDRSGKPGFDQAKLEQFFAELTAFAALVGRRQRRRGRDAARRRRPPRPGRRCRRCARG